MAWKPPMQYSSMVLSAPPVIITSARPERIMSSATPMASVEAEQAVETVRTGPLALRAMETLPGPSLAMSMGMVIGERRRGPFSKRVL